MRRRQTGEGLGWVWRRLPTLCAFAILGAVAAVAALEATCEVPVEWVSSRPDAEGTPTEVSIGTYMIDLQSIDDSSQLFLADILLSMTWRDARLLEETGGGPFVGCSLELDEVWNPRIILANERQVRRLFDDKVTVVEHGTVEYVQRLQGEFASPLELRDFPFDRQELTLEIVARGYTPDQVEFVPERWVGRVGELTITDWRLGEGYPLVEPRYVEPTDRYLAAISFRLPVERRLGFYLMKTFLPLTLIVCMSWAVFWIKPGLLPPQIGVATSAILTLIAFQFSLGYMLPRLSYLTRADRFLIGSTLLVFLAFGEALWTSFLATHDREEQAVRIDRVSRVLFPLGFILVIVFSFVI